MGYQLAVISLAVMSLLFVFGTQTKPQYGGTLRVSDRYEGALIGHPPKMTKTLFAMRQEFPALETLLRVNKRDQLIPWIAKAFEEDAKAKTIALTLRTGVKFYDNIDFDSDAVKWNLDQRIVVKTVGKGRINSAEVVNKSTVKITLSDWDRTFTRNLTWFLGLIMPPAQIGKYTQIVYQGGKWEGLIQAQPTGNPDVVVTMSNHYGGVVSNLL